MRQALGLSGAGSLFTLAIRIALPSGPHWERGHAGRFSHRQLVGRRPLKPDRSCLLSRYPPFGFFTTSALLAAKQHFNHWLHCSLLASWQYSTTGGQPPNLEPTHSWLCETSLSHAPRKQQIPSMGCSCSQELPRCRTLSKATCPDPVSGDKLASSSVS